MNNSQKAMRRLAKKNGGNAYGVHKEYDKTCDNKGVPGALSFHFRSIPQTEQPRLSKKPKVGGGRI